MPLMGFFVSTVVFVIGYFVIRIAIEVRNKAYDRATVQGYRDRIRQDPKNVGAYEQLGNACFTMKKYTEALEAYQMAVNLGYQSRLVAEQSCYRLRLLQQWRAENNNPSLKPTLPALCPSCGAVNHRSRQFCVECSMPLLADTFFGALRHDDVRRSCIEGAVAMAIVSIMAFVCTPLDPLVKFMIILFMGGLAFWWIQHTTDGSRA